METDEVTTEKNVYERFTKSYHLDCLEDTLNRDRLMFGINDVDVDLLDQFLVTGKDASFDYVINTCNAYDIKKKPGELYGDESVADILINDFDLIPFSKYSGDASHHLDFIGDEHPDEVLAAILDCDSMQVKNANNNFEYDCNKILNQKRSNDDDIIDDNGEVININQQQHQQYDKTINNTCSTNQIDYNVINNDNVNNNFHNHRDEEHDTDDSNDNSSTDNNLPNNIINNAISIEKQPSVCCWMCNKTFARKPNLKRHLLVIHSCISTLKCNLCDTTFPTLNDLKSHMDVYYKQLAGKTKYRRKIEIKASFQCDLCDKQFLLARHLKTHMRAHTRQTITCDICHEIYRSRRHFNEHMSLHTDINKNCDIIVYKKYECFDCKKCFSTYRQVKTHLKYHTRPKTKQCNMCGHQFYNQQMLNQHTMLHTGEKPFDCNICERKFRRKNDLKSHMMQHTGTKQYGCSLCTKQFGTSYRLKIHMRIHQGIRPFQCHMCNKAFITNAHLRKHYQCHVEKPLPYECDFCDRKFKKSNDLTIHLKKYHD